MRIHPSSNKVTLTVIKDDISKVRAEGVVTGEGTKLDKESTVTKSLISVLPQLQGIRSKMRDNGGLGLWTARVSPLASGSRFQYVIHAVLDKGNNDQWLRFMKTLYKNIFKEADKYKISSIALPILGSGTAGADTALSIQALVTSVLTYSPSYLTKVKVVTHDQDLLDRVKDQITYEEWSGPESSICNLTTIWFYIKDCVLPYSYYDESKDKSNNCRHQSMDRDHGGHNGHHFAPERDHKKHQSQQVPTYSGKHSDNSKDMDDGRKRRQRGHGRRCWEEHCQLQIALQVSREEASATGMNQKDGLRHQKTFQQSDEYSVRNRKRPNSPVTLDHILGSTSVNDNSYKGTTVNNAKSPDTKTESSLLCPICLCAIRKSKKLDKCGHVFCQDCIDKCFRDFKPVCPSCNMVYGVITGNQPEGNMDVGYSSQSLPGDEHHGTINITYSFPSGIQKEGHPCPGKPYKGTTRHAYLPDCNEGREILDLLRTAFDRKLTFTVGRSTTTGKENVVTWNDIHHKTNMDGGPTRFGYPDPTYLTRVRDELASKGVTKQ